MARYRSEPISGHLNFKLINFLFSGFSGHIPGEKWRVGTKIINFENNFENSSSRYFN